MSSRCPIELVVALLLVTMRISAWLVVAPPFNTPRHPDAGQGRRSPSGSRCAIGPRLVDQAPALGRRSRLLLARRCPGVVGLTLGFVAQLLFAAVQAAGELIDLASGFTLASAVRPAVDNAAARMFGRFYQLLAVTLLFATNGAPVLVRGFMRIVRGVPPLRRRRHRCAHPDVIAPRSACSSSPRCRSRPGARGRCSWPSSRWACSAGRRPANVFAMSFPVKIVLDPAALGRVAFAPAARRGRARSSTAPSRAGAAGTGCGCDAVAEDKAQKTEKPTPQAAQGGGARRARSRASAELAAWAGDARRQLRCRP